MEAARGAYGEDRETGVNNRAAWVQVLRRAHEMAYRDSSVVASLQALLILARAQEQGAPVSSRATRLEPDSRSEPDFSRSGRNVERKPSELADNWRAPVTGSTPGKPSPLELAALRRLAR